HQVDQLDEIPGVGRIGAQDILAEIGVDMTVFPTDAHLVSWAKFAPQIKESAGKRKGSSTKGQGNPWLGGALGEAATGAARSPTFLAARYKRIAKRRGTRRALVAVGHSILTIAWHLLSDHDAHFVDLGADWHTSRINPRTADPKPRPPASTPRPHRHPRTRRITGHLCTTRVAKPRPP